MRCFSVLTTALDYMEEHLTASFTLEDLAAACHFSLSGLHKLFRYAFGCSIKEYLSKRRLCHAGFDLVYTQDTVTEVAYRYQYNSPEVFSRAFARFWGDTPSNFRKTRRFTQLYHRFLPDTQGGCLNMKREDLSDLYTALKLRSGSYVLCADIVHFMNINKVYGYANGDIVLAKTARRLEENSAEEMFVFRVGNDSFVLVTGLTDLAAVKALSENIRARNGTAVEANGRQIPLSLRIGLTQIPDTECNDELFQHIQKTIEQTRA